MQLSTCGENFWKIARLQGTPGNRPFSMISSFPASLTTLGNCKPNWHIGIWVIFTGILGYYLFQIGILGHSLQDLGYRFNTRPLSSNNLGYWDMGPLKLGYGSIEIDILGYRSIEIGLFGRPGPPLTGP